MDKMKSVLDVKDLVEIRQDCTLSADDVLLTPICLIQKGISATDGKMC